MYSPECCAGGPQVVPVYRWRTGHHLRPQSRDTWLPDSVFCHSCGGSQRLEGNRSALEVEPFLICYFRFHCLHKRMPLHTRHIRHFYSMNYSICGKRCAFALGFSQERVHVINDAGVFHAADRQQLQRCTQLAKLQHCNCDASNGLVSCVDTGLDACALHVASAAFRTQLRRLLEQENECKSKFVRSR